MCEESKAENEASTPSSKGPDDYIEFWKATRGVIERMEIEFDKALLVLHPAAITASAALYAQFAKANPGQRCIKTVLFVAWGIWIFGILFTLFSFRTSIKANNENLKYYQKHGINACPPSSFYGWLTEVLTIGSSICFVLGVILAAIVLGKTI